LPSSRQSSPPASGLTAPTRGSVVALPTIAFPSAHEGVALVAQLHAGDEDAFASVFRTWYAPLVRFAERMIGDRARAEEVVQDSLLQLWRRRTSLDPAGTVQAWLFHAVRNHALNVIRHDDVMARAEPRLMTAQWLEWADDARTDVDTALAEAELHLAVDAAVGALPRRCREVFILSRRHGMRQTEIAKRLAISLKAVEAHMTRALRELRSTLAPLLSHGTAA
jgi:RNA polymerase sigma-70 factor (ECF subfamily)